MQDDDSDGTTEPTREPSPTDYLPGSKEKIEVLRMRVALDQQLWHQEDRPLTRIEECSDQE